ncbi:phage tail protein [Oscillochloris sp. ZM17-4]|uniref:phage tail protein n=1 Tax=Oscillochloris sp. ZM17-4 TaxID=2866714 RepID=UPI001C73332E|nr:phage tail protein [Oscillochloris sp. ZM17-4]MBX0331208.1 phage tail protein [Oscillochloris sp. ZM17-4]
MSQEAHPSCRFYVLIDGVTQAVFTEVGGLQIETEVMDYAEGGNNGFVHRLPGRTRVGTVTLKRGVVGTNELFQWYRKIAAGTIDRRHLSVVQYDAAGAELIRWSFDQAYPIRWVGPQLQADGAAAAVETVELAHAGLISDGR